MPALDRALAGFETEGFMPFTFDASPLQKFLMAILKQASAYAYAHVSNGGTRNFSAHASLGVAVAASSDTSHAALRRLRHAGWKTPA